MMHVWIVILVITFVQSFDSLVEFGFNLSYTFLLKTSCLFHSTIFSEKIGELDPVSDVTVENTTDSSITISWTEPEADSIDITAYRVTCRLKEDTDDDKAEREADDGDDQDAASIATQDVTTLQEIKLYGSKVTRATFHELQTDQVYVLEVFAVCKDKESEGSAVEATANGKVEIKG